MREQAASQERAGPGREPEREKQRERERGTELAVTFMASVSVRDVRTLELVTCRRLRAHQN